MRVMLPLNLHVDKSLQCGLGCTIIALFEGAKEGE